MSNPVRVLIVDDQPSIRALIRNHLENDPSIEVVGEAGDPSQARSAIKQFNPDVVTLDVEMPAMDGLEFLEKIMRLRPTPVVMVSSLTRAGADATLLALQLGAIDCVCKPTPDNPHSLRRLPSIVRMASRANLRSRSLGAVPRMVTPARYSGNNRVSLIAIGASTGGVEALTDILQKFPPNGPPTVIVQHMPAMFTSSFAARLNRGCAATVIEAEHGMPIERGCVYVAPGGQRHLEVEIRDGGLKCRLVAHEPVCGHRPSVDALFYSVAKTVGTHAVGVLLTGMGRDGAAGLLEMRRAGAYTIGQDAASCVVYGMPKAAAGLGAVTTVAPLSRISNEIFEFGN